MAAALPDSGLSKPVCIQFPDDVKVKEPVKPELSPERKVPRSFEMAVSIPLPVSLPAKFRLTPPPDLDVVFQIVLEVPSVTTISFVMTALLFGQKSESEPPAKISRTVPSARCDS